MLEHLFDAELQTRPDAEPLVAAEGRDGRLIGSGDGVVSGGKFAGSLRWTLYEVTGELVCLMEPVAVIETADGARIQFEARGYARRATAQDRVWNVAATLHFESADERYRWLDGALGVWEGEFDAEAHRACYRAYPQTT
jgi:Protein of unknown function (DUF3237)